MRRNRKRAVRSDFLVPQTEPRLSCAAVVPWKTLGCWPAPVRVVVPTRECENGQIFVASCRALCFLRAGAAAFGAADISMGTIANVQTDIVQMLARRTTVAVALG
jgi:hypothetical protein